jgi:hypothetical protein
MPCLATILITLSLTVPAMSVELFRYRGAAKDGGTLEYVFEAGVALYLNRRLWPFTALNSWTAGLSIGLNSWKHCT